VFQALKALQFFRVARVVGGESTGFDCYNLRQDFQCS